MSLPWISLLAALRKGAVLANAATWKERQVLVNAVTGLLLSGYAVAKAQGWLAMEVDHAALVDLGMGLGAALFAAYNIVATVVTTDKVGLPAKPPAAGGVREPARPAASGAVSPDPGRVSPGAPPDPPNPFLDN